MQLERRQAEPDLAESVGPSVSSSRPLLPSTRLQRLAGNQAVGRLIQDRLESGRAEEPASKPEVPAPDLIVDDSVIDAAPGQMRRTEFLERLREEVCRTAGEALEGTIFAAAGCPWIDRWFTYYGARDSRLIERAIRRYAPGASGAASAAALVPIIAAKVRESIQAWTATGEITGVPQGIPGDSRMLPDAAGMQFKAEDGGSGHARQSPEPRSVLGQLGAGQPLAGGVRSQMESAFRQDFSAVRVHTDSRAGGLSSRFSARAFTIGSNIAFAGGQYRPGTLVGDALLAHELAHVVQQKGVAAEPQYKGGPGEWDLEEDADNAAVSATLGRWGGIAHHALPRLKSGLRLQRCSFAKAPTDLVTVEDKAAWIQEAIKEDKEGTSSEIAKVFMSAETTAEFLEIQQRLSMTEVLNYLGTAGASLVGTMGPVIEGGDILNRKRVAFIARASRDYTVARAQVFAHLMFSTMHTDDMRTVLAGLAADKQLKNSILLMPEVRKIIAARGIELKDFKDAPETVGDFFSGLGRGLSGILLSKKRQNEIASDYAFDKKYLPEQYANLLSEVDQKLMEEYMSPANIVKGLADYVTFGIPGGLYGLVSSTGHGVYDLTQGEYGAAGYELSGAAAVLFSYGAVKGYAAVARLGWGGKPITPSADLLGPAGPGQFLVSGFTGPIPKDIARLGSIMQLSAEAQAYGGYLLAELGGEANVIRAARYVQNSSQAALLAYDRGVPGLKALVQAEGDAVKAAALLGPKVAGQLPPPQSFELASAKVSPQRAGEIAQRVVQGQPGLDPAFRGKVGGATFFVSKGEPYAGIAAEQTVSVQVSVYIPTGVLVFDEAALVRIHAEKLAALFEAEGAVLPANFRDSLQAYIQSRPRNAKTFPHGAAELNLSNTKLRRLLGPQLLGVAERQMWEEVGVSVVNSQSGVGRVVQTGNSPYSVNKPGEFLIVRDPTQAPVVGGDAVYQHALEEARKKSGTP